MADLLLQIAPPKTTKPKKVLCLLPSSSFDPTETSLPYTYLTNAGHSVTFATPDGLPAQCDPRMLDGRDLPWLWKTLLRCDPLSAQAYAQLVLSESFLHPAKYADVAPAEYDALVLPGGHDATGMVPYLEDSNLQTVIVPHFFAGGKPVGAICHGTLLAGRSKDASGNGKSCLFGRRTTGLRWDQEWTAYLLTFCTLGLYYRTYPAISHQADLQSHLERPSDYEGGPIPINRDTPADLRSGFVVRDGKYLSARWPGDANLFSLRFCELLEEE